MAAGKHKEALSEPLADPLSPSQGDMVRQKIGATRYLECSAKTGEGVREVFEQATRLALVSNKKHGKKSKCSIL